MVANSDLQSPIDLQSSQQGNLLRLTLVPTKIPFLQSFQMYTSSDNKLQLQLGEVIILMTFAVLVLVVNIIPVVRANHHHIRKKVKKAVRNISQLLFTCKEKNEGTEDCFISSLD